MSTIFNILMWILIAILGSLIPLAGVFLMALVAHYREPIKKFPPIKFYRESMEMAEREKESAKSDGRKFAHFAWSVAFYAWLFPLFLLLLAVIGFFARD